MYWELHHRPDLPENKQTRPESPTIFELTGTIAENQVLIDTTFTRGLGAFLSGHLKLTDYNTFLNSVWTKRAEYLQRIKVATTNDDFQKIILKNLVNGHFPFETADNLLNAPVIRKAMFGFVAEELETATPVTTSKTPSLQAITELDTDTFEAKLTALASLSERIPHALAVILQNGSDNHLEGQHKITKERFNEIIKVAKSNRAKMLQRCRERFEGLSASNFLDILYNELVADRISPEDYKRLTQPRPGKTLGIPLVSEKKD